MKMTSFRINGRSVSRLSINGREVSIGQEPVACDALCFTAEEPGSTVKLTKSSSEYVPTVNLQTSTNGRSWTPYTVGNTITLANVDDKVYFKAIGSNERMCDPYGLAAANVFSMTGKVAASGNVNSLLEENEENARTMSITRRNYCLSKLFYNCKSLTKAPELPATDLSNANRCYSRMFDGCTSLTQAPALPATTLASECYIEMFYGCTSLTQSPTLPVTTLVYRCYAGMFYGCSNLNYVKVPFTNWDPSTATTSWLPNNAGTFECPQELINNTTERTTSTVPESWNMVAV